MVFVPTKGVKYNATTHKRGKKRELCAQKTITKGIQRGGIQK